MLTDRWFEITPIITPYFWAASQRRLTTFPGLGREVASDSIFILTLLAFIWYNK